MASREEGKDQRRRLILKTARRLISGDEETQFSMRALAERAGVSITTPYNLFGSKQAIMQSLLDQDIARFRETIQQVERNELERIFETVTRTVQGFATDPGYYRAVMGAVYQEGGQGHQYRTTFRAPRRRFWRELVENAIAAGYLTSDVEPGPFSVNLAAIFFSHIMEWVADEMDLDEVEDRAHYGFALVLLGVATRPHRQFLHQRVLEAQARLCDVAEARAAG